jgi:3-hydroxyisobutyrate dehydrogenase
MKGGSLNIGIIGFGEVAQTFAGTLVAGSARVSIYARSLSVRKRAARIPDIALAESIAELARDSDIVLSAVTGGSALTVAACAAPHMRDNAFYVDLTAGSADDMRKAVSLFPGNGRLYIDVAIVGAVSIHGHRVPMIAAGPAAESLAAILTPLGFVIRVLPGAEIGAASHLKLLRSVLTKGLEAVIVECFLAAESLGLRDQLLATLEDLDASGMSRLIDMFLRTHQTSAVRRLREMEDAKRQLDLLDLPQIVMPAILERLRRTAVISPEAANAASPMTAIESLESLLKAEMGAIGDGKASIRPAL